MQATLERKGCLKQTFCPVIVPRLAQKAKMPRARPGQARGLRCQCRADSSPITAKRHLPQWAGSQSSETAQIGWQQLPQMRQGFEDERRQDGLPHGVIEGRQRNAAQEQEKANSKKEPSHKAQ